MGVSPPSPTEPIIFLNSPLQLPYRPPVPLPQTWCPNLPTPIHLGKVIGTNNPHYPHPQILMCPMFPPNSIPYHLRV